YVTDQLGEQGESGKHHLKHLLVEEAIERISNAEPSGKTMPALHPTEYPRNRAQIIQITRRATSCGSRSDFCEIKLQSRRRLFEIRNDVWIVTNALNVMREGIFGHAIHGCSPIDIERRIIGSQQSFERSGDHQFQVSFREHSIGILPVEDFSLFCDLDFPVKRSRRLRNNGAVCRATTASHGSAAAMKQTKIDVVLLRNVIERRMSFVEFPRAGKHSAILIRIGITNHHFLMATPRIEQRRISFVAPNHSADFGAAA